METLYYCSYIGGLKVISSDSVAQSSPENYGCISKFGSLLSFIIKDNDFDFSIGKDLRSELYFICERHQNSLFSILKGKKVSIYQIKQPITSDVETCWGDKFMIKGNCEVFQEEIVVDIHEYLIHLNRNSSIRIYNYPERPISIPCDDHDLVDLAIIKYRMYGESVVHAISKYHPHLLERVEAGLNSGAFKEYGI
jgi:hypothetical protein